MKPAAVGERPRLDIRICGWQAFPFLILLPLAEKITGSWDVTTAGIGAEVLGSSIFWMQLIVIYLFAFGARCVDRGLKSSNGPSLVTCTAHNSIACLAHSIRNCPKTAALRPGRHRPLTGCLHVCLKGQAARTIHAS